MKDVEEGRRKKKKSPELENFLKWKEIHIPKADPRRN